MRLLVALAIIVIATNIDIYLARTGVPMLGVHVGIILAFLTGVLKFVSHPSGLNSANATSSFWTAAATFIPIFLWSLISAANSYFPEEAAVTVFRWGLMALTALIFLVYTPDAGLARAMRTGFAASILITSSSVLIDVIRPGTFAVYLTRAGGLFINPNAAAHALIMQFLCFLALSEKGGRPSTTLRLFFAVSIAVFATLSRSGIVLWIMCSVLIITLNVSIGQKIKIVTAALTIGAAAFLFVLLYYSFGMGADVTSLKRLETVLTLDAYTDTGDSRVSALRYYLHAPVGVLGYGPGLTNLLSDYEAGAHNSFIRSYWETGLIGGFAYIILLFSLIRKRVNKITAASFIIIFTQSFFAHANLDNRLFYLVLFIVPAAAASTGYGQSDGRERSEMSKVGRGRVLSL